jgi:transposase
MEQTLKTDWKKLSREERGKLLANSTRIVKIPKGWRVTSQTNKCIDYFVTYTKDEPKCSCPDCELRHKKCKHIHAVEFYIKKEIDKEGKITETKGVKISYSQDWKAYNKSQTNEKLVFLKLLRELCDYVEQPEYKFGRPKINYQDLIFSSALKVYSTFSLRRFMSDIKISKEMNLIDDVPCFASVGHFLQREEITNILKKLISISASPLREVETDFAVDSSGFSTCRFARYFSYKHQKDLKYRIWMKAHLIIGVKTNIITGVEITDGEVNDSPSLPRLVEETAKNFKVGEVSGDKAYSSKMNLQAIQNVGAVPFIPFKKNVTGKRAMGTAWGKMYHYFLYKHDEFLSHCHKRSNVETCFHMIKTKFKDNLRSKSKTAQVNELLLKILCHNICVVIQEINELGVRGEFITESSK